MCRAIEEGGRRCPIHQHQTVAVLKIAARTSGLNKRQLDALFRELRREARGSEFNPALSMATTAKIRQAAQQASLGKGVEKSLALAESAGEQPEGDTLYAQAHLLERAVDRGQKLQRVFERIAHATGYASSEIATKFQTHYDQVELGRDAITPPEFNESTRREAVQLGLPSDPATIVALAKIRRLPEAEREATRRVRLLELNDLDVEWLGWHEGRLEFQMYDSQQIHAYQNVPERIYLAAQHADDVMEDVLGEIVNNPKYQYATRAQAERDAYRVRCASCGQFRAMTHTCPQAVLRDQLEKDGVAPELIADRLREALIASGHADKVIVESVEEHPLLTDMLKERGDATVITDGTGETFIRIGNGLIRNTYDETRGTADYWAHFIIPETLQPVTGSADEVNTLMRYVRTVYDIDATRLPKDITVLREAATGSAVEIPLEVDFKADTTENYWPLREDTEDPYFEWGGEKPTVSGNLRLSGPRISGTNLKCTCAEYAARYDCRHVRAVRDQAAVLLGERPEPETAGNLRAIQQRFAGALEFERGVNEALLGDPDMTRARRISEVLANTGELDEAAVIARLQRESDERLALARERDQEAAYEREHLPALNAATAAASATQSARMKARWKDIMSPYEVDHDAFYDDYAAAISRKRAGETVIPFRTENVTDGICAPVDGARRFGVELEFDIKDGIDKQTALRAIGAEMHAAGLTGTAEQELYHAAKGRGYRNWSFEWDATVDGEIVSPIMADTPADWEQLRQVTEIIKRHGGVASVRTGSHVHVSSASYANSVAKNTELLRTTNENMDILYRLATNPERGKHRGVQWCKPNVNDGDQDIAGDLVADHNLFDGADAHKAALNFEGATPNRHAKSHVEFRMWDGTLDPAVIQQQVVLSAAMTEYAEQQVETAGRSVRRRVKATYGEGYARQRAVWQAAGRLGGHTRETFNETNAHVGQFFAKLFRREEDLAAATALFASTAWQQNRGEA